MMAAEKNGAVWVIAELGGDQIQPVSLQLLGKGRGLADQLQVPLDCILLGNETEGFARTLIKAGADRVYIGNDPQLSNYQPDLYLDIIQKLAHEHEPAIMLLGSTFMGRELAPLLAASLRTGLSAHCIDLMINEDMILEQIIPAYGGLITIICPERRPQMATVADGVFSLPAFSEQRKGEVVLVEVPQGISQFVELVEVVQIPKEGVALESARVVVAGGAGACDQEGWAEITKLAEVLNAGLGSTRPAVDEGWTALETMIGQSGKMVNPEIYIGVGLSGELQHMVGIAGAKVMIGINNDRKAPIFKQVDYGIVEDCREFIPVLLKKLEEFGVE
jgi:electron transfer flavoprotein alpha subunit